MSDPIQRPLFYEGQIINAGDLAATVDHPRGQLARHERYLHTWGVAYGLGFSAVPKKDSAGVDYKEVAVHPGVAVDGRGRELVLAEDRVLSPADFPSGAIVDLNDPDAWYPVYIRGIDTRSKPTTLTGACAQADQATRLAEDVQFSFDRPDAAKAPDDYAAPGAADGPDLPDGGRPWDVLIGFVQWDDDIKKFKDARAYNQDGVNRRLAGVRADRVEARDGTLLLQTSDDATSLRVVVRQKKAGDQESGSLTFGPADGKGGITRVFMVNEKGDLEVKGSIKGALPPGGVGIQSGVATDGLILPLPPGLTEDQFAQGKIRLHIQVVPLLPEPPFPDPKIFAAVPLGCSASDDRRVRCRMRWLVSETPIRAVDVAGTCHYTILAAAPAAGGNPS